MFLTIMELFSHITFTIKAWNPNMQIKCRDLKRKMTVNLVTHFTCKNKQNGCQTKNCTCDFCKISNKIKTHTNSHRPQGSRASQGPSGARLVWQQLPTWGPARAWGPEISRPRNQGPETSGPGTKGSRAQDPGTKAIGTGDQG